MGFEQMDGTCVRSRRGARTMTRGGNIEIGQNCYREQTYRVGLFHSLGHGTRAAESTLFEEEPSTKLHSAAWH